MGEAKALLLPATLAYVGVRASGMVKASGLTSILVGIAGAGLGLYLAKKV